MKWSLVFTFFRSLSLAHLERSLYSLSRQTIKPDELLFFDNNTKFSEQEIKEVIAKHFRLEDWKLHFAKHGDPRKTSASWGQNTAIRLAIHDVFILGKADCIYDFNFCERLVSTFAQQSHYGNNPMHFVASYLFQMPFLSKASHQLVDHAADLEPLNWRENPQRLLANDIGAQRHTAATEDAASHCTTKQAMGLAGWYDEELIGWGFWQIVLQSDMRQRGVKFHVIPEFLYFHMLHQIEVGERDLKKAQAEMMASSRYRNRV